MLICSLVFFSGAMFCSQTPEGNFTSQDVDNYICERSFRLDSSSPQVSASLRNTRWQFQRTIIVSASDRSPPRDPRAGPRARKVKRIFVGLQGSSQDFQNRPYLKPNVKQR